MGDKRKMIRNWLLNHQLNYEFAEEFLDYVNQLEEKFNQNLIKLIPQIPKRGDN